ncbi:MAG: GDSL-type esterase/lipase family protein [Chloroflexi bacterium]|nr:GDSL-type esterase/lipase family protein [Chloroflexota bacterium]
MVTVIRIVLMPLGLMVAFFGIGLDFLLPGASPGLNLPQLLIILAGLGISVVAYKLRRPAFRRRLKAGSRRSMISAALVTVITLLALELLLTVTGMSVYFERYERNYDFHLGGRQFCDAAGCRWNYEIVRDSCARGELSGRYCVANQQGYADDEDFVAGADSADRTRVLALGDSFTQGFSAEVGHSFVETFEARHPDVVVWNAGFSGSGTNQAVATFESLAPILRPDLTILGFYGNDFIDNLLPFQSMYEVEDPRGRQVYVRPFRFDAVDNVVPIDEATAIYLATHGVHPPENEIARLLGSARLGTLLLRLRDSIVEIGKADRRLARGVESTREYLRRLRELAASHDSALLVMLIPSLVDHLSATSEHYLTAIDLMEELGLSYIDLTDVVPNEGFAPLPDTHWNSEGHQKVGALLSDCLQVFIASGNLGDCEHVVMP